MSKDGGGGGSPQVQTQSIDPAARQAYLDNLELAKSTASNLGVQKFAEFTPEYQAAQQRLTNLGMTGFTPESISKFTNPYQQEVIDSAMGDIERQRQMQQVTDASSATRAGAFGGTRQAVQSALTNEAALRQGASTAAQLRSQGYGQAATLAQQAQQMGLQGAGAVMTAQQSQQALAQQRLDAERNLALQKLAIQQSAVGTQPANLGMTGTSSAPQTSSNFGAGALGGAGMAYALGVTNPWALGGAAVLGSGLLG
jgi:hypothetical protein